VVSDEPSATYLDVQAAIGITKHNGGLAATDRLLHLCHVAAAREVLYVGSGIGVGPAYIARKHGCRVVAADISDKMLEWTRRRVLQEGVEDLVEPCLADVLELPFEDERFDAVIVESVVAFVADKDLAIAECARVTRAGGWVGMNEAVWIGEPPAGELAERVAVLGTSIPTRDEWQDLWVRSGLTDRSFELFGLEAGAETRSRIEWIGWRWLLPAWGRAIKLMLSDPGMRESIKRQLSFPVETVELMGYVLSAGRR
jgi:SAM-dependent methyltransferase